MKKVYEAPALEIEIYQLDANIASNCTQVVTKGDYGGTGEDERVCDDYIGIVEPTRVGDTAGTYAYNVNFWENTCDCYTTAGNNGVKGFFTS